MPYKYFLHCYLPSGRAHKFYTLNAPELRSMLRAIRARNKRQCTLLWRVVRNSDLRELTGLRDN